MALDRFYLPNLDALELNGDEARHCLEVLRHKSGERVVVFDGRGTEILCEIVGVSKNRVSLKSMTRSTTNKRETLLRLVQAIPKGGHMEAIVQKATELGVSEIVPLISERTVVQLDESRTDAKTEKWRQTVIESAKQCGQNWLPQVHSPQTTKAWLNQASSTELNMIASLQPGAKGFKEIFSNFQSEQGRKPKGVSLFIGPEGDFTPAEISRALAVGCLPVTLGPIILRCETAALYALSVCNHELQ